MKSVVPKPKVASSTPVACVLSVGVTVSAIVEKLPEALTTNNFGLPLQTIYVFFDRLEKALAVAFRLPVMTSEGCGTNAVRPSG